MSPGEKQYPNSPEGAIRYLRDDTDLNLEGAWARPDPHVSGVWLVNLPNEAGLAAIVYLAGYPDPWGRRREHNDFEVGEPV